jgi:protease-4
MGVSLLGALTLWLPSTVLAQSSAVTRNDPSRGATQLPGSAAWADEATSLTYNPAGLTHVGTFNAWFLHERNNARGVDANGLWLAASVDRFLGLGLGFDWVNRDDMAARAKTTFGVALGPNALSVGLGVSRFFGAEVGGFTSVDLGLQSRPVRWLSFAALARNVTAPRRGLVLMPREWSLAVGLRPFGERLTIGLDWTAADSELLEQSRLQYTLQLGLLRGVRLLGGVSHSLGARAPVTVHAALGLDLDNVGYTQGFAVADNRLTWQFSARLSVDKAQSVVPQSTIAVLSVADIGGSGNSTLGSLLGLTNEDRYLRFVRFLEEAAYDPELSGVVLKIEGASVGLARAGEIRSGILKLRSMGKKVYAYVLSSTDAEYLIASACDKIFAAPEAMWMVDGLRSSVLFLGGTAEQLGVKVDVARVGAYKNFPDQFTRRDMSDEQREALNAYLDTAEKALAASALESRTLSGEKWRAAIDRGLRATSEAKLANELDEVATPQEFDAWLKKELPRAQLRKSYVPFDRRSTRWGERREIAIVPVLGNIAGGKNQSAPIGGDLIAGAESFIEAIGQAADDADVAAIVVRVDSGGGDGLASDLMYRAVLEAKKKKPVIASMGDVAASGGYFVAMGADAIYASPTTLTGSIGVFFAKPSIRELVERFGANQQSLSRGKNAGITDLYEPWTPEQRATAQTWVNHFYDTFITEVAKSRGLSKEDVDAVARGRVWSGEDAQKKGLVDQLGGLMDAIAEAKKRAGLAAEDVRLVIHQPRQGLLTSLLSAVTPPAILEERLLPPPEFQLLASQLGPMRWLLDAPGVQARMEYVVEIK